MASHPPLHPNHYRWWVTAGIGCGRCGWAWLLLADLGALGTGCNHRTETWSHPTFSGVELTLVWDEATAAYSGTWRTHNSRDPLTVFARQDWIQLEMTDAAYRSRQACGVRSADFEPRVELERAPGQPADVATTAFALRRPVAALVFRGALESGRYRGTFELQPEETFAQALSQICGERPGRSDWWTFVSCGATIHYFRSLQQAGYALDLASAVKLCQQGIDLGFAQSMREAVSPLSVDQLIALRNFGVPPDYARQLKQAGGNLTPEDLIRLRQFGVPSDYLAALMIPQRPPLPVEVIIDWRQRGVSAETARKLRE